MNGVDCGKVAASGGESRKAGKQMFRLVAAVIPWLRSRERGVDCRPGVAWVLSKWSVPRLFFFRAGRLSWVAETQPLVREGMLDEVRSRC